MGTFIAKRILVFLAEVGSAYGELTVKSDLAEAMRGVGADGGGWGEAHEEHAISTSPRSRRHRRAQRGAFTALQLVQALPQRTR